MILKECLTALKSSEIYDNSWYHKKKLGTIEFNFYSLLESLVEPIYFSLNLSVLSGDYLDSIEINKVIGGIKSELSNFPTALESIPNSKTKEKLQFFLLTNFTTPVLRSIKTYQGLVHTISKTVSNEEHKMLFSVNWLDESRTELGQTKLDTLKYAQLLDINIRIALYDHSLVVSPEALKNLIIAQRTITERIEINPPYKAILVDKCEYLIRKINYRFKEDKKNYAYAFNFQDSKIDPTGPLNFFETFHSKTVSHYNHDTTIGSDGWGKLYERLITKKDLSFNEIHSILQYYKDVSRSYTRVESLKEVFNEKCGQAISHPSTLQFDQKAIFINQNYYVNNQFSLLLEDKDASLQKVLSFFDEIKTIQIETRILNYFPYLKFCTYLCSSIDKLKLTLSEDLAVFQTLFTLLQENVKETYQKFEWCKERNFLAFQLIKEESSIQCKINDKDYYLFLASSFVLPINYVKVEQDLKDLTKRIDIYHALIEVHQSIASEKSEIKQIKKEIEKIDRRAIEIIGVFSAIVLFASGSIQIFSIDGITIKDSLNWMLLFSYSLILFTFLIWLITRDGLAIKSLSIIHWAFFLGLMLMWVVSLLYVFNIYPFNL